LQRLLGSAEAIAWLRGFRAVFVGGGPVWPELADAAAAAELPISLGYGMTETAAMATALRPGEFLAGDRSSGAPLPHLRVSLTAEALVRIAASRSFAAIFPTAGRAEFVTEDLGRLAKGGRLEVLGRRDAVIITGGEKADPRRSSRRCFRRGIHGCGGRRGAGSGVGQAVVACYPARSGRRTGRLTAPLERLAPFKRPAATWPWPTAAQPQGS